MAATRNRRNKHSPTDTLGIVHMKGCGFCVQMMEPQHNSHKSVWRQVNDKLKHYAIQAKDYPAEMDQSALDSMGVVRDGYPTIFKRVNGHVSYFPGDKQRTVQNIVHWATEHKRAFAGGKRKTANRRRGCKTCISIGNLWKMFTKK